MTEIFKMDALHNTTWHVEGTSATTGQGLTKALKHMACMVRHCKKQKLVQRT